MHTRDQELTDKTINLANAYLRNKETQSPALKLLVLIRALASLSKLQEYENCDLGMIKLRLEEVSRSAHDSTHSNSWSRSVRSQSPSRFPGDASTMMLSPIKRNNNTTLFDSTNILNSITFVRDDTLLLRRCIFKWLSYVSNSRAEKVVMIENWMQAIKLWQRKTAQSYMTRWMMKLRDVRKTRSQRMIRICLVQWRVICDDTRDNAIEMHDLRVKKRAFASMRSFFHGVQAIHQALHELFVNFNHVKEYKTSRSVFKTWRTRAKLKLIKDAKESQIEKRHNTNTMKNVFLVWRANHLNKRNARMNTNRLMLSVFTPWKRNSTVHIREDRAARELRCKNQLNTIKLFFTKWMTFLALRQTHRLLVGDAVQFNTIQIQRTQLLIWRQHLVFKRTIKSFETLKLTSTLKSTFVKWRVLRHSNDTARSRLQSKIFTAWHGFVESRSRRSYLTDDFVINHANNTKSRSFGIWRRAVQQKNTLVELNEKGNAMNAYFMKECVMKRMLTVWRLRTTRIQSNRQKAIESSRMMSLKMSFAVFQSHFQSRVEEYIVVIDLKHILFKMKQRRIIQRWSAFTQNKVQCTRLVEAKYIVNLKRLFTKWRGQTQAKVLDIKIILWEDAKEADSKLMHIQTWRRVYQLRNAIRFNIVSQQKYIFALWRESYLDNVNDWLSTRLHMKRQKLNTFKLWLKKYISASSNQYSSSVKNSILPLITTSLLTGTISFAPTMIPSTLSFSTLDTISQTLRSTDCVFVTTFEPQNFTQGRLSPTKHRPELNTTCYLENKYTHLPRASTLTSSRTSTLLQRFKTQRMLKLLTQWRMRLHITNVNQRKASLFKKHTLLSTLTKQWRYTLLQKHRILLLCAHAYEKKISRMVFKRLRVVLDTRVELTRKARIFERQMVQRRVFFTWNDALQRVLGVRHEVHRDIHADTYHSQKNMFKCLDAFNHCIQQRREQEQHALDKFNQSRIRCFVHHWKHRFDSIKESVEFARVSRDRYVLGDYLKQWCDAFADRRDSEIVDYVIVKRKMLIWMGRCREHTKMFDEACMHYDLNVLCNAFNKLRKQVRLKRFICALRIVFDASSRQKLKSYVRAIIDYKKDAMQLQIQCDQSTL